MVEFDPRNPEPATGDSINALRQQYLVLCHELGYASPKAYFWRYPEQMVCNMVKVLQHEYFSEIRRGDWIYFVHNGKPYITKLLEYRLVGGEFVAHVQPDYYPFCVPASSIQKATCSKNGSIAIRYCGQIVKVSFTQDMPKTTRVILRNRSENSQAWWAQRFRESGVTVSVPGSEFKQTLDVMIN